MCLGGGSLRMVKFLLLILTLAFVECVSAKNDNCFLEGKYEKFSNNHPLCLFYQGNQYFRNKKYYEASLKWQRLIKVAPRSTKYQNLIIYAHNNLGVVYVNGVGVDLSYRKALYHLHKAASLGHAESSYHLCYTYGDKISLVYSPKKAIPHCERAEIHYSGMRKSAKLEKTLRVIRQIIRRLKNEKST